LSHTTACLPQTHERSPKRKLHLINEETRNVSTPTSNKMECIPFFFLRVVPYFITTCDDCFSHESRLNTFHVEVGLVTLTMLYVQPMIHTAGNAKEGCTYVAMPSCNIRHLGIATNGRTSKTFSAAAPTTLLGAKDAY
jgi:hypothetical protein